MEPPPARHEYFALAQAALVLVIVLLVCFMGLQLYRLHRAPARADEFAGAPACRGQAYYNPTCGGRCPGMRQGCQGLSRGAMPEIDTTPPGGLCGGLLGVPA